MDKKVLYALTTKIFSALKKLGIKPKIGVTTDIQRLPGANSFNTDFSTLTQARPESLKKVITADADFLAKANPDELRQYYNNLEYVQANFPEVFSKPQVVTEAKTGIKTLVDDLNENLKGKKSMETVNPKTGEVTSPKEPITTAEKKYFYDKNEEYDKLVAKHKKAAEAHDQLDNIDICDKIAPDQLGEVIAEMSGKNVDRLTDAQRREYYKLAQSYLTDFIKVDRTRKAVEKANQGLELNATDRLYLKFAQPETKPIYKQGDPITSENFGDTPFAPDLSGLEKAREISEAEMIKQKYGNIIDDNLLKQILVDDNPQRKAEVMATIDEAMKMQDKGIPYEEIINIIKNTTRTKQADGGLIVGIGTMFKRKR